MAMAPRTGQWEMKLHCSHRVAWLVQVVAILTGMVTRGEHGDQGVYHHSHFGQDLTPCAANLTLSLCPPRELRQMTIAAFAFLTVPMPVNDF